MRICCGVFSLFLALHGDGVEDQLVALAAALAGVHGPVGYPVAVVLAGDDALDLARGKEVVDLDRFFCGVCRVDSIAIFSRWRGEIVLAEEQTAWDPDAVEAGGVFELAIPGADVGLLEEVEDRRGMLVDGSAFHLDVRRLDQPHIDGAGGQHYVAGVGSGDQPHGDDALDLSVVDFDA